MPSHIRSFYKLPTVAVLLLIAVTGCNKAKKAPPTAAVAPDITNTTNGTPTASITADPMTIDPGQSVVLNWRTTNASAVAIDGIGNVAVNGTQTVTPSQSTNFHLTARNDTSGTYADVRVTVRTAQVPSTPDTTTAAPTTSSADTGMSSESAFHAAVPDLFFDYDSYDLRADAQSSIAAAASFLSSHPAVKVLVAGYCDDRGSAEYNITLGENRANAAKTALVSAGVSASRIRVVSYGKEKQFCSEENDSCWQQNRRDQFTIDR